VGVHLTCVVAFSVNVLASVAEFPGVVFANDSKQIAGPYMASIVRPAVIGLGSNLGDRVGNVLSGASMIARLTNARRSRLSPLYETVPVGGPPQGNYINAAIELLTDLPARSLLMLALAVEQKHGRLRLERFGPRTLDIDILWIEGEVVDHEVLTVPHPRLVERSFALKPMLDLVPDSVDPRSGQAFRQAMAGLSLEGIREIAPSSVQCGFQFAEAAAAGIV